MGWIVRDLKCECGHSFEALLWNGMEGDEPCPQCSATNCAVQLSAPGLAIYSMADKDTKAQILRKRSREHTMKEIKKDPSHIIKQQKRLKLK